MALATYSDLLSALATYSIRSDQTANWPTNVAMGQARLNRLIRARQMVTTITGNFLGATVALPSDFLGVRALRLTSGDYTKLEPVSMDRMDELKASAQTQDDTTDDLSGDPLFYSISGLNIEVYPEPAQDDPYQLSYYQQIPDLATESTNWLMALAPDAYLYASLEPYGIMVQDDRLPTWQAQIQAIVGEINDLNIRVSAGDRLTPQTNQRMF